MLATSIIDTALHASSVARKLIDRARSEGALELHEPNGEPRTVDLNQLMGELVERERRSGDAGSSGDGTRVRFQRFPVTGTSFGRCSSGSFRMREKPCPADRGTIEISTHTDSRDWVVVTIRDSGCGMSQEVQRRAGEPFFRPRTDTRASD